MHPDGSWSLLHLGSGRWVRVLRESGCSPPRRRPSRRPSASPSGSMRSGQQAIAEAAARADAVIVAVGNDPHLAGPRDRGPPAPLPARRGRRGVARRSRGEPPLGAHDRVELPVRPRRSGGCRDRRVVEPRRPGARPRPRRRPLGRPRADRAARPGLAGQPRSRRATSSTTTPCGRARPTGTRPTSRPFAFGHGLTYSTVAYESVTLAEAAVARPGADAPASGIRARATRTRRCGRSSACAIRANGMPRSSCRCTRSPTRPCRSRPRAGCSSPIAACGSRPARSRDVELEFAVDRLAVWDDALRLEGAPEDWLHAGALRVQPGRYVVAAGPSAWEVPARAGLEVVSA